MGREKTEPTLTRERILEFAEEVLRRYGPNKATVVDVARALGVSHGAVYKHFASKADLRDAILRIWLARIDERLQEALASEGTAEARLRLWLDVLIACKRQRAADDPELFATYMELAEEAREVVQEHVMELVAQVDSIIKQGIETGEFTVGDHLAAAKAVLSATSRFHHPRNVTEWSNPGIDEEFEAVYSLILSGLKAG